MNRATQAGNPWKDKLLKPLRLVTSLRRGLRQLGGARNVMRKAWAMYRRDGVAGIRQGLTFISTLVSGRSSLDRNNYEKWVARYDTVTDETRQALTAAVARMPLRPTISVLMPVYNPDPKWLVAAIESVRKQIYPDWELCIADDASGDPRIRETLEQYRAKDARIKIVFRDRNGHISAASNSALELASGEWICLFDHDDLLSEHALFWIAEAIATHPGAGLVYSDEDKITEKDERREPHFKPDWNYTLFLSYNLISHLGAYRTAAVKALGGFRLGYEGAQDYDLALRYVETLRPEQIIHVPRVLYHWRIHASSTAQAGDAKPYALVAGEKALNDHLGRIGVRARATLQPRGYYRVRYDLPETLPLVSLIIPTRNGESLVRQCIDSIREKTRYSNYEIILVDNGSDDPAALRYFGELARTDGVTVVRDDRPFNYSALNNQAVAMARGEFVALVNNDIEVISPDWLGEMVSLALQPGIGAVGARLLYPNNLLQHGGVILGLGGIAGHGHKHFPRNHPGYFYRAILTQEMSAVTAACLLVRRQIYQEVGGLEENKLSVAFNDVDFCIRLRQAGYRNVYAGYAELYHHESVTRGFEDTPEKKARFKAESEYMKSTWPGILAADPAYSPNLTRDYEDFSYAWPPRIAATPVIPSPHG
ncbi:glycosyl transferase family 2 [Bordetella genomosp. 8]|uniref:Glycosyl transferase family 2 n=1 Tax=Bordetella genomosp. 8 TaxID=1416806 RepID=A0A1W6YSM1_9BORD|nr:glycosyltransferase family 2 protein [Bordetella genomosp. 8]ARP84102.1 glycosyl transferase family 2 [Bordetella genomosp. 8]